MTEIMPTKPPRGVKQPKETNDLLMTIIRSLSTSESNEQRDFERTKLEKEYKKSNLQLEQLVSIHHQDLTIIMKLFGRLSSLVSQSRQKVHGIKRNLIDCKKLLTCRREELKKLWLEDIEYKRTLELIQQIEQMKDTPSKLAYFLANEDYLQSTRLLISAITMGEGVLEDITGLQELKTELQIKKEELKTKLLEAANDKIYEESVRDLIPMRRQGSARNYADSTNLVRLTERRSSLQQTRTKAKKKVDYSNALKMCREDYKLADENEFSDDAECVLSDISQCLLLLKSSKTFLENLKKCCKREILSMTSRTAQRFVPSDPANALVDYFQILANQLKKVLEVWMFLLERFQALEKSDRTRAMNEVWLKIQAVVQILLTNYLDIPKEGESEHAQNAANVPESYDISSFFTRKKLPRTIKGPLFKFNSVTQKEVNEKLSRVSEVEHIHREKLLAGKPTPNQISQSLAVLSQFLEDVEQYLGTSGKEEPCKLRLFLNNYKNSKDAAEYKLEKDKTRITQCPMPIY